MGGEAMAGLFSSSKPADCTKQKCAYEGRKVVSLKWVEGLTWCSEEVTLTGTTSNYADGEGIPVALTDRADGKVEMGKLSGVVGGNAFPGKWQVLDILPSRKGEAGYLPRREVDGRAENARTPRALSLMFVVNFLKSAVSHRVLYDRTNPAIPAAAAEAEVPEEKVQVGIGSRYGIELSNYQITLYGDLKYVRGWGKERLELGDKTLTGGFELYKVMNHWGKYNAVTTKWQYWDGSAWQATPSTWKPGDENHFSLSFYKSGSEWICREDDTLKWPDGLTDWVKSDYEGPGNLTETTLTDWKSKIETTWTDKFDLKRVDCKSTLSECCRYKTRCVTKFTATDTIGDGVLVISNENVRSNATMWAMGDDRDGLAPHEFGHLLGAPDEYEGVFSTQLGLTDKDGLKDGVDPDSMMGSEMLTVKKRHFKGICEVMNLAVKAAFGKDYKYEAVDKASNLALPAEVKMERDPGASAMGKDPNGGGDWNVGGALLGGLAGAAAGAALGYFASNKDPRIAIGAGVAGALAGAGLGLLF
ncbi:MAG: hypothetical protein ACKV2U_02860 [Bryobacteraceae bacterium]